MNSIALSLPDSPLGFVAREVLQLWCCCSACRVCSELFTFRTPRLASLKKSGAAKVRCAKARSLPVMVRPVFRPGSCVAVFTSVCIRGNTAFIKNRSLVVAEGKMAYVYARDGVPLEPMQTLGRNVDSNHFQDAMRFLEAQGQRGRQRGILREGVYAINLALFVVITEERVFSGPVRESADRYESWKAQLAVHARV